MKNVKLLTAMIVAILWAGSCAKTDNLNYDFELGKAFETQVKEINLNSTENLKFRVVEVQEDSRCPMNTNCVWAGRIKILAEIKIDNEGTLREFIFIEGKDNTFEHKGYHFEILAVTPDVQLDENIEPEDYNFILQITKN